MKTIKTWSIYALLFCFFSCTAQDKDIKYYQLADYGIKPDTKEDIVPLLTNALKEIRKEAGDEKEIIIRFEPGRYDFHPVNASQKTYYISNHDQTNPKSVGIALEDWKHLTLDGQGASFVFHGRMLPISLLHSSDCRLENFSIDFEQPHIAQACVLENDTLQGKITLQMAPWVDYKVRDNALYIMGEGWELRPTSAIAFDPQTRHLVYRTGDVPLRWTKIEDQRTEQGNSSERHLVTSGWINPRLTPGTVLALRTWERPAPGIFLSHNKNTELYNLRIHYAEGMGVLAQLCENIHLDSVSVCLKGPEDPRYFTTQADATHFSQCKGTIISENGLYENMMDDAINVHGTYLKVKQRLNDSTLIAAYMHGQTYGFDWGYKGDTVQFIRSRTMEALDSTYVIANIRPEGQTQVEGAKQFRITFDRPLPAVLTPDQSIGIENLTWTPKVYFAHNVIRNNRARGSLFSTPQQTLVEENLFDHTSGTAILLCGDCNGWYETGACHNVWIRKNRFINALTNLFQFTNAVISIYPEIPELDKQTRYFHRGIRIEDNYFETFDHPILYAKSVDGLIFRRNEIKENHDFPPFHWNQERFLLERVANSQVE